MYLEIRDTRGTPKRASAAAAADLEVGATGAVSGCVPTCQRQNLPDNETMSATEVIEQIKALPADELVQVARFIAENSELPARRNFSVATATDGLPVIRVNGGTITSRLVHEIESRTP